MYHPHAASPPPTPAEWPPSLLLLVLLLTGCGSTSARDYREAVDDFVHRAQFNGVVLVAQGDSILHAEAYGYEDVENRVPTQLDTRYQLGSVAKWVTSLAVLRLVDQGALSLSAPVRT